MQILVVVCKGQRVAFLKQVVPIKIYVRIGKHVRYVGHTFLISQIRLICSYCHFLIVPHVHPCEVSAYAQPVAETVSNRSIYSFGKDLAIVDICSSHLTAAKVGDIKYSDKSSAGTGWLLCNGGTYSKTTYPQLYDLIGTKFGSSSGSPKLPNYQGVFLRGYGSDGNSHTNKSLYTLQDSEVKGHTHSVSWTGYYADFKAKGGGYGDFTFYFNDSAVSINISTGSGSTCPVRKALYPFIYAGVNANGA